MGCKYRKRSNSARLPSKMTSWVLSWQPRTNAFWDFSVPSQYCVCHENMRPGHTKCCTCHAKASYQTWRSDASKCNPSEEITALTSQQLWWTCLLYCACHTKDILPDPLQMSHTCHRFGSCHKTNMFGSLFTRRRIDCAPCAPCAPRCTQQGCKAVGQSWNWLLGWLCPSAAVDISISLSLLMLRLIVAMWVCTTCRVVAVLVSQYPCKVAKLCWWHLQLRDQDCGRLGWRLPGAKRCSFRLGLCLAVPAWSAWFSDYFCRLLLLLCQFDWGCHWSSACTCACVRLLSSEAVPVICAPPASGYFSSCRIVGRCGKIVTAAAAGTTLCFLFLTQLNVGAPPQYCMTMTDWDFHIHENTVLALRPWQESPYDFIPQPKRYKCTMQQAIHLAQWMPRPACTSRQETPSSPTWRGNKCATADHQRRQHNLPHKWQMLSIQQPSYQRNSSHATAAQQLTQWNQIHFTSKPGNAGYMYDMIQAHCIRWPVLTCFNLTMQQCVRLSSIWCLSRPKTTEFVKFRSC